MSGRVVYIDGRLLEPGSAMIHPADAGFECGDGLFETLRVERGHALRLHDHLARLFAGLERLQIVIPEAVGDLAQAARTVAGAFGTRLGRMRITVTAGPAEGEPTRLIRAMPYRPPSRACYDDGVDVVSADALRIHSGNPLCGIKSISYGGHAWVGRRSADRGGYDGLVLNERDELVETTRCNLVAQIGQSLVTPPLHSGCLPGIVRADLLASALVVERSVRVEEFASIRGMALSNSLVGVLPVRRLDDRELAIGPALRVLVDAGREARG